MKVRIEQVNGLREPEAVIRAEAVTEEVLRAAALLRGGVLNGCLLYTSPSPRD